MDDRTYRTYADYGPTGAPPASLELDYRPSEKDHPPESLEAKISDIWELLVAQNPRLHNGKLLNLINVSQGGQLIRLGQVSFRDYFAIWSSIYEGSDIERIQLTDEERRFIHQSFSPISSYMAVIARDKIIVGLKDQNKSKWLSFPGSGYFDAQMDAIDRESLHSIDRILRRELDEELNIGNEAGCIRCLGIYGERQDGFYTNPAFFSVTRIDSSPNRILESAKNAEDEWEFEKLFTIPIEEEILKQIIEGQLRTLKAIPAELPQISQITPAPKTPLMLALIGRMRFGDDWYQSIISETNIRLVES